MALIKNTTQEHLDIESVKDNYVLLKNGGVSIVLETTAVNFDLLSEIEQDAMITAFAMLLNSLTFPIQIVLRSKRLDITKYLEKIHRTENKITDPLLKAQMEYYRKFVQDVIETNEVLNKKFYVVLTTGGVVDVQMGNSPFDWILVLFGIHNKRTKVNVEANLKKARVTLEPKVEHITAEFNRLGVKTRRLNTQELVELYFDIYNPSTIHGQRIRASVDDYTTAVVNPAIIE